MASHSIEKVVHVENTPEAVIAYVSDVRNRPLYLPALKSVSEIKDGPGGVGTTWKWTWLALGMEWEGVGRSLKCEPGKLYAFKTEGGIESTWTYTAEPEAKGTKLTIHVDYDIPEKAKSLIPAASTVEMMKQTETDRVVQNLKSILDR
jgi:carbon monoxide dehydrogenase subunit G